jgi:hypothetical protein
MCLLNEPAIENELLSRCNRKTGIIPESVNIVCFNPIKALIQA